MLFARHPQDVTKETTDENFAVRLNGGSDDIGADDLGSSCLLDLAVLFESGDKVAGNSSAAFGQKECEKIPPIGSCHSPASRLIRQHH